MPSLTPAFEIPDSAIDLLVVGLGPAGVACALQARRDGLSVLALGDEQVGGLVRAARRLTNLPAEPGISGAELAERMDRQVEELGLPAAIAHVSALRRTEEGFSASLADGRELAARTVCLATGTRARTWDLSAGGRHVHRDARSLTASLGGKRVVVVGGGEAALDTALTCRDRGAGVTVLARGAGLRAVPALIEEAREARVEVQLEARIEKVQGEPGAWMLRTTAGEIQAQELIVCIGRDPRDELARQATGDGVSASVEQHGAPGLFLAGDLIRGRDRFVATAMGDGQRAAVGAATHVKETG